MRAVTFLSFIVVAVMASVFASVSPAAAQGTGSDPSATGSAIRARSEGSYSPPRYAVPPAIESIRLGFRFAFARYLSPGLLPTRTLDFSIPADLPTRRRSL